MRSSRSCNVCVLLLCGSFSLGASLQGQEPAISDKDLVAQVDTRLAEWWLKPDEQRFDQIGWAADVRTARRLAAEANRPLFLFTMDGRVNTGRC
jgi:hypothetical protein